MVDISKNTRNTEIKLIKSLREFDKNIYYDYCDKATAFYDDIKHTNKDVRWILKPEGTPNLFFYHFKYPIYLLLSHPISRFKKTPNYWISSGEESICLQQALVPTYLFTLNTFSVVRLWNEAAQRFFSPTAEPLSERNEYWGFSPKQENTSGAYISSLNFILKDRTNMRIAPKRLNEIINSYFKYLFWSFPKIGYSCNSHFLYDQNHITTFFKITKSIMSIYLGEYDDKLDVGHNSMDVVRVGISCLVLDNKEPEWLTMHPILTKNVYEELSELDTDNFFINGIISEFRRRGGTKINTLNIVAKYGYSSIELINSIIGMLSWNAYIKNNDLTYVEKRPILESYVKKTLKFLSNRVNIEKTVSDIIEDIYDYAFSELYPVIITINDEIHLVNPIIFSILEKHHVLNRLIDAKENFNMFISLINNYSYKLLKDVKQTKLYKDILKIIKFEIRLNNILLETKYNIRFFKKYHNYMILDNHLKTYAKNDDVKDSIIMTRKIEQNIIRKIIEIDIKQICENCLGIGYTTTIKYHREDRSIQPIRIQETCKACKGTGKVQ